MKLVFAFAAALSAPALHAAAPNPTGCFVHAFAREQFRPPMTTYTGPRQEPVFMKDASSVIVGPNARLVGYAGGRYRKESIDIGPDTHVPDLAKLGFDRRVDAFKLLCGDGDPERL